MLNLFANAWKVPDIRKKMLFTIMVLAIYRVGTAILVPGAPTGDVNSEGTMLLAQMLLGGGKNLLSVFALGIGPYITSSIIMQLLCVAVPKLEAMQKEGEDGRRKINNFTRYLAVFMACLQASATVYNYHNYFLYKSMPIYIIAVLVMICGTTFIMWLAETITQNGIGNGTSMIIFANIISGLPSAVAALYNIITRRGAVGVAEVMGVLILFTVVISFVVCIQQGERRLPVQYSKKVVGKKLMGGQSSYIPIKLNIAGVISIIFAISLLQFPQVVGGFTGLQTNPTYAKVLGYLNMHHPIGATLYVALIIFFTFFYTSIVFNPVEVAENMKKNGGFIPGIRPGLPTSQYITKVVGRVTVIGAMFYSIIAIVPLIVGFMLGEQNLAFGGTTIIIVVGVALDTVKQIESQLLMRHYKGFLSS